MTNPSVEFVNERKRARANRRLALLLGAVALGFFIVVLLMDWS